MLHKTFQHHLAQSGLRKPHSSNVFKKINRKTISFLGHFLTSFFVFILCPSPSFSQVGCFSLDYASCGISHPNATFICIDASTTDINNTYWIGQGALLDYFHSAFTPQFIVIKGMLHIKPDPNPNPIPLEYTFAPGSEIIFADNFSGIEIEQGAHLKIKNTDIHGCGNLWASMKLDFGGNFEISNSTIKDGKYAIWGSGNGATLSVINNTFRRNLVSVVISTDPESPNAQVMGTPITHFYGNEFWGDDQLYPTVGLSSHPVTAIKLCNSKITNNIGENGAPENLIHNFSEDFQSGIFSSNSKLSVVNTRFINAPGNDPTLPNLSCGICSSSLGGVSFQPSLEVSGQNNVLYPTFENFHYGIFQSNVGSNTIKNVVFNHVQYGVIVSGLQDQGPGITVIPNPIRTDINNCTFSEFINFGIYIADGVYPPPVLSLSINDNTFQDTYFKEPPSTSIEHDRRFGIRLTFSNLTLLPRASIYHNTYDHTPNMLVTSGFHKGGISLSNVGDVVVGNNSIHENDDVYDFNSIFTGIELDHCKSTKVINNQIVGSPSDLNNPFMHGITNLESTNSILTCNEVEQFYDGMFFKGISSDANLRLNSFQNHANGGIDLDLDAIIGTQVHGENKWIGNMGTEAYMDWNGFYDPTSILDQSIVQARGRFIINSSGINNANDIYFPSPRYVQNSLDDVDNIWFTSDNPNPLVLGVACSISGPPAPKHYEHLIPGIINEGDQLLVNERFPLYTGEGWRWDAGLLLYSKLNKSPGLRTNGNAPSIWFNAFQSQSAGSLSDIYEAMQESLLPSEQDGDQMESLYQSLDLLNTQTRDMIWSFDITPDEKKADLKIKIDANLAEISSLDLQLDNLINNFRSAMQQKLEDLSSDLNNIETSESLVCENNFKSVLQVQIDALKSGLPLTANQNQVLNSIARKCRYTDGWGVAMARLMLHNTYSGDFDDCRAIDRGSLSESAQVNMRVTPNPAVAFIDIHIIGTFNQGSGRLTDIYGRSVKTWTISQESEQINIQQLPNGIYLLEAIIDGHKLPAQKIIVIK